MARPRKPTVLKELAGEKRPSRIPKNEPKPKLAKEPTPPKDLKPAAKAEWKRAAKILSDLNVLTEADLAVLRGYCVNYADAEDAEAEYKKEGITLKESRGAGQNIYTVTKEHPAHVAALKARKQMLEFARELGFSPVSRTKVSVQEEKEHAELIAFEGGKGK